MKWLQSLPGQKSRDASPLACARISAHCTLSLGSFLHLNVVWTFSSMLSVLSLWFSTWVNRLVGLVVKASASRTTDAVFWFPLSLGGGGIFQGQVIPVSYKLALKWLPFQAPGVIGSALGLVGSVSVHCAWVRQSLISNIYLSVAAHTFFFSISVPEVH